MYKRKDFFYHKAKKEGYASRSAYKLLEIARTYPLIKQGDRVVDIGCAPGGWLQVACSLTGERGIVVGVDKEQVKGISFKNMVFIHGDILEKSVQKRVSDALSGSADVVLSDASPRLSGIRERDHRLSLDLACSVFEFASTLLIKGGNLLTKIIDGPDTKELSERIKRFFHFSRLMRPDSTRRASRENYILGVGFNIG